MKRQITFLSTHQAGKIFGLLYFLLNGIFCLPIAILAFLTTRKMEYLAITLIPFAQWFLAYILVSLLAGLYNFAARNLGGIEYYSVEVD